MYKHTLLETRYVHWMLIKREAAFLAVFVWLLLFSQAYELSSVQQVCSHIRPSAPHSNEKFVCSPTPASSSPVAIDFPSLCHSIRSLHIKTVGKSMEKGWPFALMKDQLSYACRLLLSCPVVVNMCDSVFCHSFISSSSFFYLPFNPHFQKLKLIEFYFPGGKLKMTSV